MKKYLILLFSVYLFANPIGTITYLKGKALIIENDKNITAKKGMSIEVNNTIITFKHSKVKIVFKDKTKISLGQNTKFIIKEYQFDENSKKAKFKFVKGVFRSITGQIGKMAPKRFKLITKNASIGIRGTIVIGKIMNEKSLIACEQGAISITSLTTGQTIFLNAGEGVFITSSTFSAIFNAAKFIKNVLGLFNTSNKKVIKHTIMVKETNLSENNLSKEINSSKINQNDSNKTENNLSTLSWKDYIIDKIKKEKNKEIYIDKEILEDNFRIK